jgi:hypothetical protein
MLKLIEQKWNLAPLTRRDAAAASPLEALDLDGEPTFATPPQLPAPTPGLGVLETLSCAGRGLSAYFVPALRADASAGPQGARHGRVVLERVGRAGTTLRSAKRVFTSSAEDRAVVPCRRCPPGPR